MLEKIRFILFLVVSSLMLHVTSATASTEEYNERLQQCEIKKLSFEVFMLNYIYPNTTSYLFGNESLSSLIDIQNALYSKKFQDNRAPIQKKCGWLDKDKCKDYRINKNYLTESEYNGTGQDWDLIYNCNTAKINNVSRWDHYNTMPGTGATSGVGQALDSIFAALLLGQNTTASSDTVIKQREKELKGIYSIYLEQQFLNNLRRQVSDNSELKQLSKEEMIDRYKKILTCLTDVSKAQSDGKFTLYKDIESGDNKFSTDVRFQLQWESGCEPIRQMVANYCNLTDSPCSKPPQ